MIEYLSAKNDDKIAPFNVRPVKDLNERKTADIKEALEGKNFFSDRDHILINQSINDDNYVIPNSLEDSEYGAQRKSIRKLPNI